MSPHTAELRERPGFCVCGAQLVHRRGRKPIICRDPECRRLYHQVHSIGWRAANVERIRAVNLYRYWRPGGIRDRLRARRAASAH